jgi:hypothetical protein
VSITRAGTWPKALLPNVFAGAELRYLRAHQRLRFQQFEGPPLFLGPTLYAKLSDRISVSAAFSSQIAGRSQETPGHSLDLANFSRREAKLKVSYGL